MTWGRAVSRRLADRRLHLQHGPIDLIIEVHAAQVTEIERAYQQAIGRFDDILETLVKELSVLRAALSDTPPAVSGPVGQRMLRACWPYRDVFITPMAAVAGAVADEVLSAMVAGRDIRRAYVNNGGDIAIFLAPGERFQVGVAEVHTGKLSGDFTASASIPVRGVATSGWRGRSLSLGIADAVTVAACNAANADAAATMIANAVNVLHPAIERLPARAVRDDSDLLDLPVTVHVDRLPPDAIHEALEKGITRAREMQQYGLIHAARLTLQDQTRMVEPLAVQAPLASPQTYPREKERVTS